mmetsp:Transcript_37204/g.33419  ORF Transcript_37204/g.33419 Transcript_37204/m.33419 type:complete len:81 (-) Transcript_37204:217-459(-)
MFCKSEDNRHKKEAGDLGEFIIKLGLSSYGINDPDIMYLVMKEHMCRQVSWCLKADKSLGKRTQNPNFVKKFMEASQISN